MIRSLIKRMAAWRRFGRKPRDQVFAEIYETRYWGDEGSVSGPGSRNDATIRVRAELPRLFERFNVRSVYDAPCGDFAWMREVVSSCDVSYVGADIVPAVVDIARSRAEGLSATFLVKDIVIDPLPACDLWLCRDCLFHLDHESVFRALVNFANSDCSYLLITNHPAARGKNRNIVSGDYRDLNMFMGPFWLPDPLYRFDDSAADGVEREMVLFDRSQIQLWLNERRSDDRA